MYDTLVPVLVTSFELLKAAYIGELTIINIAGKNRVVRTSLLIFNRSFALVDC